MTTEIRVTMKRQFRAIQWTGDNYDDVCALLGFKPKRNKYFPENLQVGHFCNDVSIGDYIVINTGLQVLTTENFNRVYAVAESVGVSE
jgi:hypothetical protein